MAINLKDYEPALMQGANIDISLGDVIIDDLTVGDDATITGDLAVTGGSTVAALTASGAVIAQSTLAVTGASTLSGAVNYKRQVTDTGGAYATPVVLTAAQSGRVILVDDAAGLDFTLPAIGASDIGMHFKFVVTVTITSNNFRVTAATGDLLFGGLWMPDFDAAVDSLTREAIWITPNGSSHLVMTMNGSTTGGKVGTWVEFIATSATQWFVHGIAPGDGAIATPFS